MGTYDSTTGFDPFFDVCEMNKESQVRPEGIIMFLVLQRWRDPIARDDMYMYMPTSLASSISTGRQDIAHLIDGSAWKPRSIPQVKPSVFIISSLIISTTSPAIPRIAPTTSFLACLSIASKLVKSCRSTILHILFDPEPRVNGYRGKTRK
jgi:hypothetical protein